MTIEWGTVVVAVIGAVVIAVLVQVPSWILKRKVANDDDTERRVQTQDKDLAVLRAQLDAEKNSHSRGDTQVNNALRDLAAALAGLRSEVHDLSAKVAALTAKVDAMTARIEQVAERAHKAANVAMANRDRLEVAESRITRLEEKRG